MMMNLRIFFNKKKYRNETICVQIVNVVSSSRRKKTSVSCKNRKKAVFDNVITKYSSHHIRSHLVGICSFGCQFKTRLEIKTLKNSTT